MENVLPRENQYRNFLISSSSLLTKVLVNFVSICILARLLPAKDFGIYSILTFLFYLVVTLGCLSANFSIIKANENINFVFTFWVFTTFLFNVFSCVVLYFFVTPITEHFGFQLTTPSILLLLGSILFASLANVGDSLSQKLGLFRSLRNLDMFSNVFSFGLVLPLSALWLKDYRAFLFSMFSFSFLRFLFLYTKLYTFLAIPKDYSAFRSALKGFDGFFTISQLANFFALHLDNLIVGSRLGTVSLGFYSRAYQLVSLPGVIIGDALDRVFFPHFKSSKPSFESKHYDVLICQSFLVRFFLPMSAALIVFADDVVHLILGEQWKEVGDILRILSLAMFLKTSAKFLYSFLKAHGSSSWLCVIQLVYLFLIAFAAFAGSTFGLIPLSFFIISAIFVWWVILFIYVSSLCKNSLIWGGFIPDYAIFVCWMLVCCTSAFYIMLGFRDIISLKVFFAAFWGLGWCYFLKSWLRVAKTSLK